VESDNANTPKSGVADDLLSTLPLIIINLLSTVKMSVESYNEKILGECVANTSSHTNHNDQNNADSSFNVTTFILKDESFSSLDSDINQSNPHLNKSSSFNQSSSTLSCLSNSVLQALENNQLSSRNSSRSDINNEFPSTNNNNDKSNDNNDNNDNNNDNSDNNKDNKDNNNSNNNNNDDNDNSRSNNISTSINNSCNDIEKNENEEIINHSNVNVPTYTPLPIEEERKETHSQEGSISLENTNSKVINSERSSSIPNEKRGLLFRERSSSLNSDKRNVNLRLRERKDSNNSNRRLNSNESMERRGREMSNSNRERYERSKSRDRRIMDGNESFSGMRESENRNRSKSCDHRGMNSTEDVKEKRRPEKVNINIYPKRLDSFDKSPILQMKGDFSMSSEASGSNSNSPFMNNCKAHGMRTPSMDNIPSAISVDTGIKINPHIIHGRQRNVSNPTPVQLAMMSCKTPKLVNYDPALKAPKLSTHSPKSDIIRTPNSSNLESAKTPLFSELLDNVHSAVPQDYGKPQTQGIVRKRSCSASYAQNPLLTNNSLNSPRIIEKLDDQIPNGSDSTKNNTLKSIKSSSAIQGLTNNYNSNQEGVKKQNDSMHEDLNTLLKSRHVRNVSEGSFLKHRSDISTNPNLSSFQRKHKSNVSVSSVGTDATEQLNTGVQFIKNFDKPIKMEGMDRRSYLYEDYFNRNSDGELIDLQMVLVPLNNMFEICTVDLNEPIRFGRSNVDNVENFKSFRSLVISRSHAEIWSENNKIYLKDLGSNGGTFLNGVRICQYGTVCEPHEIKSGDFIQFGQDFYEGGIKSPKMDIPENPKHRCVKFQIILSNSININLYKNYDSNNQTKNSEQEELENQRRDIEQQILEQNEKLKKQMENNLAVEKVRDHYYINISGTNNKIRKAIIRIDPGIELFSVDLSNWDQKTSIFSLKDKYKNNKILVHDNRPEYFETQNIEILKELSNTKVFSIKTKYSLLGTVQYTTKKKVQIVTPYGSPQFCITGDFKEHQWIILETHINNDDHNQRCIGEAKGKEFLKKGVRETKWEIKLEVEKSQFSQLLFSSFLFLIVTGRDINL